MSVGAETVVLGFVPGVLTCAPCEHARKPASPQIHVHTFFFKLFICLLFIFYIVIMSTCMSM